VHEGARAWLAANVAAVGGRVTVGAGIVIGEWRQQLLFAATGVRRRPLPLPSDSIGRRSPAQVALPDPRSDLPPWSTLVRNLLRPEVSITGSRDIVRLYDERGRESNRPSSHDLFAFLGAVGTPSARWRMALGPIGHAWSTHDVTLPSDANEHGIGGMARAARLFSLPSAGPDLSTVPTVAAEALWLDRYRRFDVHADLHLDLGSVLLQPRAGAGWGDALPLTTLFVLGGPNGFPGIRPTERRGDQMMFASVAILRRVRGPLYAFVELGRGRTALVRPAHPEVLATAARGWITGAEAGFAADTPVGTFRIGYGLASTDRPVFKIRLGN
jgi:hypothetical protein